MRSFFLAIAFLLLTLQAAANDVQLNWNPPTDNVGAARYKVYRNGIYIGFSTTNSYIDHTAQPSTTYNYTVSAVDAAGNESAQSTVASVTTGTGAPLVEPEFVPLHKYFISTTGNDANDGLTPATTWATPNHPVVCGDVIIVQSGTYNAGQFSGKFGNVSNCPSTTGGIDGAGGIYFAVLLCGGPDLMSCKITGPMPFDEPLVKWHGQLGNTHNWAVSGFLLANAPNSRAFEIRIVDNGCTGAPGTLYTAHHIASINNVVTNTGQAFGLNDCGIARGQNPPAADYLAIVGTIAQNSNQDGICLAALDFVGTGASDGATSAIKGFMYGNFAWSNQVPACNPTFDGEGIMFDTMETHKANGIWTAKNNVVWNSMRYGIHFFWQCATTTPFTVNFLNNTVFANNAGPGVTGTALAGEINVASNTGCQGFNVPVTVNIKNNIGKATIAQYPAMPPDTSFIYAFALGTRNQPPATHWPSLVLGTAGNENVWKGQQTVCVKFNRVGSCDPGNNVAIGDSLNLLGTNFYVDPAFTNETDLLTNRLGVPNCTGFKNVTACMGWDAHTGTLTVPSVISDLTANAAQAAGKGYQRPSTTCVASDPDYPPWLKGVVYLQVTGSTITQRSGLVTRPCGF